MCPKCPCWWASDGRLQPALVGNGMASTRQTARPECFIRMAKEKTEVDPLLQPVRKLTTDMGHVSVCVGQI